MKIPSSELRITKAKNHEEKNSVKSYFIILQSKFIVQYFLILFFLLTTLSFSCKKPDNQPNILLIMVDDMGFGDMSLSGNPYLKTPILDSLSQAGIRFTDFYVSSVCAPTRASLLTGRYHQRTGVRSVTNGFEIINPNETTIAEILKANGYRTGIFGKWHLGEYYPSLPNAQGFEEYIGFRTGHTESYFDPELEHNGKQEAYKGYITDILTDEALRFMKENRKPFFCYLPYNAPHTPLQIDSQWFKPYLLSGLEDRTARIYGMMANIDANIGRMVKELKEAQILDNTIVIFLSDNGPISGWKIPQEKMRYNAGLRDQKFTTYDGGIRTQSFWLWPRKWSEAQEISEVAAHIDILPTLLDAVNISIPDSLRIDGMSLLPIIEKTVSHSPERIFFQNFSLETLRDPKPYPGGIARKGKWKMANGSELYNLSIDPGEKKNLAEEFPDIFEELKKLYTNWYEEVHEEGEFFPRPIPVGYSEANQVWLKPHHGRATGNLKFLGKRGLNGERIGTHPTGVDGDWIGNWREKGDEITWEIEIIQNGVYEIAIDLRGNIEEESFSLDIDLGKENEKVILPPITETKDWQLRKPGEWELSKGEYSLSLTLDSKSEKEWLEINHAVITRQ